MYCEVISKRILIIFAPEEAEIFKLMFPSLMLCWPLLTFADLCRFWLSCLSPLFFLAPKDFLVIWLYTIFWFWACPMKALNSSPTIVYYIFHIKPHLKKKNILKLSLGRFLWNLFQDTQNSLNFISLSDSHFCRHGFCFLVI